MKQQQAMPITVTFTVEIGDEDEVEQSRTLTLRSINDCPFTVVENGEAREAVFDVACSDGLAPDPDTHRCPDNGANVNLAVLNPETGRAA